MPTLAAKNTHTSTTPLLYAARNRPLEQQEIRELRRLCDVLTHKLPERYDFNQRAETLCSSIHTSGLLERGCAETADQLLSEVDNLQRMLG